MRRRTNTNGEALDSSSSIEQYVHNTRFLNVGDDVWRNGCTTLNTDSSSNRVSSSLIECPARTAAVVAAVVFVAAAVVGDTAARDLEEEANAGVVVVLVVDRGVEEEEEEDEDTKAEAESAVANDNEAGTL